MAHETKNKIIWYKGTPFISMARFSPGLKVAKQSRNNNRNYPS